MEGGSAHIHTFALQSKTGDEKSPVPIRRVAAARMSGGEKSEFCRNERRIYPLSSR
jgi:hypothetical protein